jgi:predicted TIM-barrel fold metal-dependent hydrolase
VCEAVWVVARPLTFLIWGGVFERFPKLRVVVTEGTASWVPHYLEHWDERYEGWHVTAKLGDYKSHLSMKPSDYYRRNVRTGSFLARREIDRRAQIGVGTMMWGSDYPHPEGTWPHTREAMRETFRGLPEDEIAAMLGGNAAEFYRFDTGKLAPIVARIGPEKSAFVGSPAS